MKNLIRAELHKAHDTLTAKIIIALAFGIACLAGCMAIYLNNRNSMSGFFFVTVLGSHSFIGILTSYFICQEWRYDLVLTTYVSTPRRLNVVIAKLCVVLIILTTTLIFLTLLSFLFSFIASVLYGGDYFAHLEFNVLYGMAFLWLAFSVLLATAMSYCIKDQAWSIALYLLLPSLTMLLAQLPLAREIDYWLILAYIPSIGTLGTFIQEWYHILVSAVIWMIIPLGVGIVRSIKEDV